MKNVKFDDCDFYDYLIKTIDVNREKISLQVPEANRGDFQGEVKITIDLEETGIDILFIKQYPLFHRVKLKGKEISIDKLKSLLKKGNYLFVDDYFVNNSTNCIIFDCIIYPFTGGSGVFKKVILKIYCKHNYVVLEE